MILKAPLWQRVLIELYKTHQLRRYASRIHRKIGGSFNHMRENVQKLKDSELIRIVPKKNRKLIELTQKGEKVVASLLTLKSELNRHISCNE